MSKKLQRIMLVDDDVNTNIYHEIILNQANAAEDIVIFQNGKQALNYLKSGENKVDLIFLDINMPIMDGWQFLESYNLLDEKNKASHVIVMLTTSINAEDKEKARTFNIVKDFISKPLKVEVVNRLLNTL